MTHRAAHPLGRLSCTGGLLRHLPRGDPLQSHLAADNYRTRGGIDVHVSIDVVDGASAVQDLMDRLDAARGVLLSSSYEYPGRYTRWDMGFVAPPLVLTSAGASILPSRR